MCGILSEWKSLGQVGFFSITLDINLYYQHGNSQGAENLKICI